MENLKKTTFIIPVCVESIDRLNNAITVLGYLNYHFETNIIIHEITSGKTNLPPLDNYKNTNIKHIIDVSDLTIYHRTRQLNEMLNIVDTPVVVNYDIDVILPVKSYIEAVNMIISGESDVVYPYGNGVFQRRVFTTFNRETFNQSFNLNDIELGYFDMWDAKYGHCVFLNTEKYRAIGGENEKFIAYGPEDSERYERFQKIGYRIDRIVNDIYHLEHSRTPFSDNSNQYFNNNNEIYLMLNNMSKDEIIDYYFKIDYRKKYKNFLM